MDMLQLELATFPAACQATAVRRLLRRVDWSQKQFAVTSLRQIAVVAHPPPCSTEGASAAMRRLRASPAILT
jgi:hypothetical protein